MGPNSGLGSLGGALGVLGGAGAPSGPSRASSWTHRVCTGWFAAPSALSRNPLGTPISPICHKNQRFFVVFGSAKMTKTPSWRSKGRPWAPSWAPPVSLNGPLGGPRAPRKTSRNSKGGPWGPQGLPRSAEKRVADAPGSDLSICSCCSENHVFPKENQTF